MDVLHTLGTVASIFLLLLVGYGAKKVGALKAADASVVNSVVVNVTMPAFIFVSVHGKPLTSAMIKAPVVAFAAELVILGAVYLVARAVRLDRRTTGALMLVSAFGNTGFMGYGVVAGAFHGSPHAVLTAVIFDVFGMALALYSVGGAVAICSAGSKLPWICLVEFTKTPMFWGTVVALALRTAQVPDVLMRTITLLAGATVPLAMISIGLSLSTRSVRDYPAGIAIALLFKMILLPAIVCLALPHAGVHGVVQHVAVLEAAMPPAVMSGVVSARYGANGAFAAAAIFALTLASMVSLPIVLVLL